jgi:hypothetical protein
LVIVCWVVVAEDQLFDLGAHGERDGVGDAGVTPWSGR